MRRRLLALASGIAIACVGVGFGSGSAVNAQTTGEPVNTGTLTICLDKAGGAACDVFNGSVGLAPNPQLVSNTLYRSQTKLFGFNWSQRVAGTVQAISTGAQTATITINVQNLFGVLDLGSIGFVDPGSGVGVNLQVFAVKTDWFWCGVYPGCPYQWRTWGNTAGIFANLVPGNINGEVRIT